MFNLQDPFWISFFPACLAEVIGGIVIIVGIGAVNRWLISRLITEKPQAKLVIEQTTDRPSPIRLNFWIANTGKISFRAQEVRWDLYVITPPGMAGIQPYNHFTTTEGGNLVQSGNATYMHYTGLLLTPVFSGVNLRLFYSHLPQGTDVASKIYYVLSTPYGQVPHKVKRDEKGRVIVPTAGIVIPYEPTDSEKTSS
jgi:hypothetical protein